MGVSTTAAQSAERNEGRGKVQLDSLKALAEGLDCEVVYALVPRQSIQGTLERRAKELAKRTVNRVSISMELEEQGVAEEEKRWQVEELAANLLRERPRRFWDD
jgi:predicted DNA-binding mobile mystery protein A